MKRKTWVTKVQKTHSKEAESREHEKAWKYMYLRSHCFVTSRLQSRETDNVGMLLSRCYQGQKQMEEKRRDSVQWSCWKILTRNGSCLGSFQSSPVGLSGHPTHNSSSSPETNRAKTKRYFDVGSNGYLINRNDLRIMDRNGWPLFVNIDVLFN